MMNSQHTARCRGVTACLAILFVSGCASQMPSLIDGLNQESPCCASIADFEYTNLPADDELKFSVGPGDEVYLFSSGKSYFKAFRKPESDGDMTLEVRTYLVGQWIPTAHVFAPYITILDDSFQPVGEPLVPDLLYDEGWMEGARWTGIVTIPAAADYIVIDTAPELANKKITLGSTSGYAYATGTGTVYVPPSGERSSSLGVSGNLRVRFLPTVQ